MRGLLLLRGLPGSGKSTLALEHFHRSVAAGLSCAVYSTDEFFLKAGIYLFDSSRLDEAHEWNQERAREAMRAGTSIVIIDNTNLAAWEMRPYVEEGMRHEYTISFLLPNNPWAWDIEECARRNNHGVSREKIGEMLKVYEANLTIPLILGAKRPSTIPANEIDNPSKQTSTLHSTGAEEVDL